MTIWDFNRMLALRLLRYNLANIWIGWKLRQRKCAYLRGIGTQAIGWGIINVAIAVYALTTTRRRLDQVEDPLAPEIVARETQNIRRALMINTPLNLLYVLGGQSLARSAGRNQPYRRGSGWGIIIQGMLLFVHDLYHVANIPDQP